jgi:hypothetical protein
VGVGSAAHVRGEVGIDECLAELRIPPCGKERGVPVADAVLHCGCFQFGAQGPDRGVEPGHANCAALEAVEHLDCGACSFQVGGCGLLPAHQVITLAEERADGVVGGGVDFAGDSGLRRVGFVARGTQLA